MHEVNLRGVHFFVWGNEIGCVRYYDGGGGFIKGGSYDEI